MAEYLLHCWNCLGEFDTLSSVWCSCNPNRPTKVCPFCLQCFCNATEDFHDKFWSKAPQELIQDREMLTKGRGPLGEALVKAKAITSDQLLLALKRQGQTKGRLGEILVEMGFLTQETLGIFLSRQKAVMHLSLKETPPDPMLIAAIGAQECSRRLVAPVSRESLSTKELLTLAMADPSDGATIDFIQNVTGCQILPMHTTKEEIEAALAPYMQNVPAQEPGEESGGGAQLALELIRKALARSASDLYLEPKEDEVSLHLRIDGILYKAKPVAKGHQAALVSELKRLLHLSAEISDRPQEGRVVMRSGEHRFDMIAHSLPTRFGENLSIKIIGRDTFLKSPEQLGFPPDDVRLLRAALTARQGVIIVSAPLFHGSTTTLYSLMNEIASEGNRKIMSIESHSICPVSNVSQVSLGESVGEEATFTTLKALANIQPDACVLGDLLDFPAMAPQMLKFAPQMLLIATLEANGAVAAVQRLLDLGVPPLELSQYLLLAVNQRLVRKICPDCRQSASLSEKTLRLMGLSEEEAASLPAVSQGQGCQTCSAIGYKGRLALFETLAPSAAFRKSLSRRASDKILARDAARGGMSSMRECALAAVRGGQTTIEEFQKGNF